MGLIFCWLLTSWVYRKAFVKEARRALIQLESAKIYPSWNVPIKQQTFALEPVSMQGVEDETPYHFWKGYVTDTLTVGEVQLILSFERENDPKTIRVLGFLLEFYHDGVKDAFFRVESKRSFEKSVDRMAISMSNVPVKDCSLAEGRQLILDALAVNKRYRTNPHKDYQLNRSLVNRLVLEASNQ